MAFSLLVTFGSAMALCATIRVPADYPTIQGAIDAADAGDAIEISAGLYRESILIDKSIEISGAGSTRTFIQGDPGAPIADITVGTVLFEKLCVGRPGEQTPGVRRDLTGQDHIGNAGVVLRSSCFALFRSCAVQSNSYGILVLDYARLVMSRCSVSANWEGVSAREHSDVLLKECAISQNLRCGVDIGDHAQAVIAGSTLDGNEIIGVQVKSHASVAIDQTSILGPGGVGVWASGESGVTLVGSTLGDASKPFTRYGLHAFGDATLEVRDTTIQNAEKAGIHLGDDSELAGFGSTISDCLEDGITATDASTLQMMECAIGRSGEVGIRLQDQASARLSLSGVHDNGLGIDSRGESSITAIGSRFEGNDNHLELQGSSHAALHQCQFTGGLIGIELSDSATVEATDSAVVACESRGLVARGSATAHMNGCRLLRNLCGILLEDAAELTLLGSEVRESQYGIYAWQAGCAEGAEGSFHGTVFGRGNVVENSEASMCPAIGSSLWPEDFFDTSVLLVPSDYPTIQEAIDAALPGDTVRLAEGEYDERVSIDKPLTLQGAGCTRTLIHKRYIHDSSQDYPAAVSVSLDAGMVVLRDLGVTDCGVSVSAAMESGASLSIANTRFAQLGDCTHRGLVLEGEGAAFLDSCFFYGQRTGVEAADVFISLRACTFGALWEQQATGLRARGGAHVLCTSNTFFGHAYGLSAPPPFGGIAAGSDNYIDRQYCETWPVPGTQDSPWPAAIIAEGYTEAIDGLRLTFLEGFTVAIGEANYARAIELLEDVVAGLRQWPNPLLQARALFFLALALERSGSIDQAVPVYVEAIRISELFGQSVYEVALASHYFPSWESLPTAQAFGDYLDESRPLRQALSKYIEAQILSGDGDFEEAKGMLREVLDLLEDADGHGGFYEDLLWLSRLELGIACEGLGSYDVAVEAYFAAIAVIEQVRSDLASEELKTFWYERTQRVYEHLVKLLYKMGEGRSAFPYVERCRARKFLDLLAAGPVGTLANIADEGIRSGIVDAPAIEADLAQVIGGLPADTAALEYFVTDRATYVWVVRDGAVGKAIEIDISRQGLREEILTFRTTIEASAAGLSGFPNDATLKMSRDLYDLLIGPVEDPMDGIEHLVVVPSGPLYYLPFCALLDCQDCEGIDLLGGEYLVERFSLSYMPSLATLKYTWASAEEVQTSSLFLALADPDSGDAGIPRLPDAREEVTAVAGMFTASEVYLDVEATEEIVGSRASSSDQLLLATHGTFNPVNPMFSFLSLSPTEDNEGRLHTHEILSLDLHADLVTLSACETLLPALAAMEDDVRSVRGASPDEVVELSEELLVSLTAGDEIVGLTRAFIYAGTPSVLSTLWRVVSETTEPLMVAFYSYLQQGLDKAEALRRAQLDVMEMYPHPRYWAAFELVGDWEAACDLACLSGGRLSQPLVESLEEWIQEGAPGVGPTIRVLVVLHESITQEIADSIAAVSFDIEVESGYGRMILLSVPLDQLVGLSRLPEIEQIIEPPVVLNAP